MRTILLLLALCQLVLSCTLCAFRTPPRPRPLDQYKLPKLGGSHLDLEKIPKFCNASKVLPVGEKCKRQFEKIFCSTDRFTETFGNCQSIANKSLSETEQCSQCAYQKARNGWVMKWFDSLGKPAAGITEGNYYWLGDYESCTSLRSDGVFDGQYCRIEMDVPDAGVESGCPQTDPLSIILGVCFPSDCSMAELASVSKIYLPYDLKVECESENRWSLVTVMLLIALFLWLVPQVVATCQDSHDDSILGCFSIPENAKRTFSTRRETPHLHLVHGLEFLSFFLIVTGMVYNFMLPYIENVAFSFEGVSSFGMHIVNNYSFHIDGLLALSAFYTTYLLFGNVPTLRSVFDYILMRFFRFWPAYVICVLFMYVIFPGVSSGPMWIHTDVVSRCESGWWKNVLFVNNWFNVTDTCVDFGYVISMEAQYFALLVFVIFLACKQAFFTQIFAYIILFASIAFTFIRAYQSELPPAPMLTLEPEPISKIFQLYDQLMLSPFSRISDYCLGFIFGIGCATSSDFLRTKGLSYRPHIALAIACVITGIYPFVGALSYSANAFYNPVIHSFYAAFHRPFWAFSLLSLIYLCHHGAFKWLNALLEWRVFAPLSKLTWIALVVAEPIILYFFSSLNKPAYATHWSTMYTSISATILAYFIAMVVDIFVTRPIRYLIYREQKHRYAQAHTQDKVEGA
uniref:NRF domain-containing protein n=1 Tax=Caenorhabditis japonica TaxID=281687 RepID=A0A8R1HWE9_CAEJA